MFGAAVQQKHLPAAYHSTKALPVVLALRTDIITTRSLRFYLSFVNSICKTLEIIIDWWIVIKLLRNVSRSTTSDVMAIRVFALTFWRFGMITFDVKTTFQHEKNVKATVESVIFTNLISHLLYSNLLKGGCPNGGSPLRNEFGQLVVCSTALTCSASHECGIFFKIKHFVISLNVKQI